MAVPQLTPAVENRGATVRVTLPVTALPLRPLLTATDPATGEQLYVAVLPEVLGRWSWTVDSGRDQVLVFTASDALIAPAAVLLDTRARRILARELKRSGASCGCQHGPLEALRRYHALALLLFAQGGYASCQDHLTLLQDLEPCPCAC